MWQPESGNTITSHKVTAHTVSKKARALRPRGTDRPPPPTPGLLARRLPGGGRGQSPSAGGTRPLPPHTYWLAPKPVSNNKRNASLPAPCCSRASPWRWRCTRPLKNKTGVNRAAGSGCSPGQAARGLQAEAPQDSLKYAQY